MGLVSSSVVLSDCLMVWVIAPCTFHAREKSKKDKKLMDYSEEWWSSILKTKDICDMGTRWLIQNGESINFW